MAIDLSLVRNVFSEQHTDYAIDAYLTRFGDLEVFVSCGEPDNVVWQGSNILEARAAVNEYQERRAAHAEESTA